MLSDHFLKGFTFNEKMWENGGIDAYGNKVFDTMINELNHLFISSEIHSGENISNIEIKAATILLMEYQGSKAKKFELETFKDNLDHTARQVVRWYERDSWNN